MKKIQKIPFYKKIIEYLLITIGSALAAFSLETILVPNSILDGGVNGISIILNLLFKWNLSLLIIIINIPFLYIGFKNLGLKFLVKAIYSIIVFSLLLEVFSNINPVVDELLLAAIYGSLVLGLGVGLIIRSGGCLDGTESLGIVISKSTSLSVGQFVLICNVVIFSVAGIFFGIDRALYSLLSYFITSKVIDEVSEGFEKGKAALIICDNGKKMAEHIYTKIGRTCTILKGNGLISGEKAVLYCVITRIEVPMLRRIVIEEDQSAFITITDISEIIGNHIKSKNAIDKVKSE